MALLALAVAIIVGAAALGGCGSGDGSDGVEGPLPVGPDEVQAYTERFLSDNPRALAQLEHLVIVDLEATHDPDGDTCVAAEGVDCIPYFVDEPTIVELGTDGDAEQLARLMLVDSDGNVVVEEHPDGVPSTAVVEPGEYTLELHHVFAGEDAPAQMIFIQPTEPSDEEAALLAGTSGLPRAGLQARSDCIRCDFTKAELFKQNFDGLKLIGSTFYFARMADTTFRNAVMDNVNLTRVHPGPILAGPWSTNEVRSRQFDADFSGAILTGATISFFAGNRCNGIIGFIGRFRNARLENVTWDATVTFNDSGPALSCLTPDFRNAEMRGGKFKGIVFAPERLEDSPCTFQGADLTGAEFQDNRIHDTRRDETHDGFAQECDFTREPESGRRTVLAAANLRNMLFIDSNLTGVDLRGADLTGTMFTGRRITLAGVDLSGAVINGPSTFKGLDLTRAVLSNLQPPSLNGFDLEGTVLAGVSFAGIDLSQTDLSRAVLVTRERQGTNEVTVVADFTGAKLSDGAGHGVNLSGQTFPARYEGFKGADLRYATLERAGLFQANLEGTRLQHAKLVGANLNFTNLRGAFLEAATLGVEPGREAVPASLRGAYMPDVDLSDADLRSVDMTGAHLYGDQSKTKLLRTRLDSANLSGAVCSGAQFSGSLNNTVFNKAQLVNTEFNGATLTNAKFDDAYLQGANFANAISVNGVSLSNAAVSGAPGTWSFHEEDGTPFTLRYEATQLGALATSSTVRCPNGDTGPCCPSGNVTACLAEKLKPAMNGPFPPVPDCVPQRPRFDNCVRPAPQ